VGEIEDKVPCRDTYPFDGNWVKEDGDLDCPGADLPLYPHGVGLYESSLQLAIFILKPLG
jgi:hypothetical protein